MPAVRTRPRDVIVRVTKAEPYSIDYVSPSSVAKPTPAPSGAPAAAAGLSQLVGVPLDGGSTSASVTAPEKTTDPATAIAAASISTSVGEPGASGSTVAHPPVDGTATATEPGKSGAAAAPTGDGQGLTQTAEAERKDNKGREKTNPPTLSFVLAGRDEKDAVPLSKASTSSAEWNSLLIWARRQRGAQWDSGTAMWHMDKYSEDYYSFCNDPTQSASQNDEGGAAGADGPSAGGAQHASASGAPGEASKSRAMDEDDDKGPTPRNWAGAGLGPGLPSKDESPPPVAHGRSARLLRR